MKTLYVDMDNLEILKLFPESVFKYKFEKFEKNITKFEFLGLMWYKIGQNKAKKYFRK